MGKEFKLQKITLFNMFNYRDKHVIDFSTKHSGNIFLFDVKNGGGKTSLFMSIKWGFYGFDHGMKYVKNNVVLKSQDFMNQDEYAAGSYKVIIDFIYDGHEMQLRRECPDYRSDRTELTIKIDGVIERGEAARERVMHILPPDYGDFMMFDGETLDKIALQQGDKIKTDNVLKLLGLMQLRELRAHLSNIHSSISTEFSKGKSANSELQHLMSELDRFQEKEARLAKVSQEKRAELDGIQRNIWDLEERRRQFSNVQSTIDELTKKSGELNRLKQNWDDTQRYIREHSNDAFILFMEPDIRILLQKHEDKQSSLKRESRIDGRVNNEYGHIRNKILVEHLASCPVCSSVLTDDVLKYLGDQMAKSKDKGEMFRRHQEELSECNKAIGFLRDQLSRIPSGLDEKCNRLYEITEDIEGTEARIDELNEIASQSEVDAIREITGQISDLSKKRSRVEAELFEAEKILENTKKNIANTRAKINKSGDLSTQQRLLSSRLTRVEKLIKKLDRVVEQVSSEKRADILAKANEVFLGITNKEEAYRGLEYDDKNSFSMHIVRMDGAWVRLPSSGETHVLAISFLIALSLNTERLTPMMMDTPLSRLDDIHKPNVGRTLANLDNQVIFLAQPGELDDDTKAMMMPSVAKMFIAEPTEDNTAHIVEGAI